MELCERTMVHDLPGNRVPLSQVSLHLREEDTCQWAQSSAPMVI